MTDKHVDEGKGRIKQATGTLTGDDSLKREGQADQAKSKTKDTIDKVADKAKNILDGDKVSNGHTNPTGPSVTAAKTTMSDPEELSVLAYALLDALRSGPLDVHQLCADLTQNPDVAKSELQTLSEAGLVHGVTVHTGRQAWGLTVKGRRRIENG